MGSIDLTLDKMYEIVDLSFENEDRTDSFGLIRIVDDSGEDYLYPAYYFEGLEK
jgi:hypothetical protein